MREPFGVVQGALLTLVGLILAFGLAMAVGRYEARRAAVVDDANAIGTAYLRAQTLHEPQRSGSLQLYPGVHRREPRPLASGAQQCRRRGARSRRSRSCSAACGGSPGESLDRRPTDSAPRLYVESLNEMIDMQTTRLSALNNRVPSAFLWSR